MKKGEVNWRLRLQNLRFWVIVVTILAVAGTGVVYMVNPGLTFGYDEAKTSIERRNYHDVVVNDRDVLFISWWWGGCLDGDDAEFEATAKDVAGNEVKITACARVGKGFTIRTDD